MVEILATYDPESSGGNPADGRKVKGATIHWVKRRRRPGRGSAAVRQPVHRGKPRGGQLPGLPEPRLPEGPHRLQGGEVPGRGKPGESFQFLRQGYFCADNKDSLPGHLVFNRSVKLKDSFKPA